MQFMPLVTRILLRTRPTNKTLGPHIATWIKLQRQNQDFVAARNQTGTKWEANPAWDWPLPVNEMIKIGIS